MRNSGGGGEHSRSWEWIACAKAPRCWEPGMSKARTKSTQRLKVRLARVRDLGSQGSNLRAVEASGRFEAGV